MAFLDVGVDTNGTINPKASNGINLFLWLLTTSLSGLEQPQMESNEGAGGSDL